MAIFPSTLYPKLPTSSLSGQFILCKTKEVLPEGWQQSGKNDWILAHHHRLSITNINEQSQGFRGWLLGYAIDPLARQFAFGVDGCRNIPGLNGFGNLEDWLNRLTGRFAAIAFTDSESRLYLDAAGGLSSVWCARKQICASSPMLIPYDKSTSDDVELCEAFGIPDSDGGVAFGLTPRHSIQRLLPNHFLDLENWRAVRHWPSGPATLITPIEAVNEISQMLAGTIQTICSRHKPYMSLTAGRDSRMLLACSRGIHDRIQFFTWELPDYRANRDVRWAHRMKQRLGLMHQVFPFSEAGQADKEEWLYRTGCAVGEVRGLSLASTLKLMDGDRFYLSGHAGEVGRCFYWRPDDTHKTHLDINQIVHRLSLPPLQKITDAGTQWLNHLPLTQPFDVLDFLYIEQRLGCWAGVTAYGDDDGPLRLPPFSNRKIFALMLGLPYEFRLNQNLARDLISACWPELLDFPFNSND